MQNVKSSRNENQHLILRAHYDRKVSGKNSYNIKHNVHLVSFLADIYDEPHLPNGDENFAVFRAEQIRN